MLDHLSVVILRQRCRTGVWKCVVVVLHNELQFFSNQKVEIILEEANVPESCLAKTYLKWKLSNLSSSSVVKRAFGSQQHPIETVRSFQVVKS